MNFTSYEISKQLHEAGFKAETNTLAHPTESIFGEKYLAYDLETLLKALPPTIEMGNEKYELSLRIDKNSIFAAYRDKYSRPAYRKKSSCSDNLADEVATLFLDLKEATKILKMNLFYFLDYHPFSTRLINSLRGNFNPDSLVADLATSRRSLLLSFDCFGKKTLKELESALSEYGLTLIN